jgi:tetratricopeptide (TPR) repeat protein/predicted Ser/Thr protein kinase
MNGRVENLFHELADLSKEARARYYAERTIDTTTQKEVEALLAFDSHATTSLARQIGEVAERALGRCDPTVIPCGPFRLGKLLGRGGMGAVYLGEREDGEVSLRVAIKLLRPGADDPQVRQRFLAERQILATLSHPQIARLLDAGHREDGQPYLVMEYVKGEPIDVYSAQRSVRQKVALFLKVCGAVSYLHRNLVVHRDLKPSNILVTEEGEPKLLDFGLAKMLDLTTDSTLTSMRMLTPDYASPEQVAGGPVTTATDVYSLGAILYKLLTEECPHKFESDSAEAIARTISAGKIVPPAKLAPVIKSDLETILMKALRTEPQERYPTVDQFSEDLENFLESRPIRARKGDAWYRTRKILRRYWIPVTAAALTVASLSTGLAVANHERAIAQRRFMDVRHLANKLFEIDLEARKTPGNTKVRELIVDTSLEYLRRVSADAKNDPELALEVGNAYMRVARVQGVPIGANLGQIDRAEQNLRIAEEFIHSVLIAQPANRTALLRAAQIAHDRMLLARNGARDNEALALARVSEERLERLHADARDKPEASGLLNTYMNVADQFALGHQYADALRVCNRGSDLARTFNHLPYLGTMLWVAADLSRRRGDLDGALKQIHESVSVLDPGAEKVEQARTMNFVYALINEGRILGQDREINLGRPEEAIEVLNRAFTIADHFVHQDANDQNSRGRLAVAGLELADIVRHSDPRRALDLYDHTLRHLAEILNNSAFRRYEVEALVGSTYPLRRVGRGREAKERLDGAFQRLRDNHDYPAEKVRPGSVVAQAFLALAENEANGHHIARAVEIEEQLLGKVVAYGPKPDVDLEDAFDMSQLYESMATMYRQAGLHELGSGFEARRLALWRHWDAQLPHNSFVRRQLNAATGYDSLTRRGTLFSRPV